MIARLRLRARTLRGKKGACVCEKREQSEGDDGVCRLGQATVRATRRHAWRWRDPLPFSKGYIGDRE